MRFRVVGFSVLGAALLVAAGLALFVITLIVNMIARIIVNRTSQGTIEA